MPAAPLLRRRLRGDLGRRANGAHRLRGHQEAAGGADHRPLRAGPGDATRELMADPARLSTGSWTPAPSASARSRRPRWPRSANGWASARTTAAISALAVRRNICSTSPPRIEGHDRAASHAAVHADAARASLAGGPADPGDVTSPSSSSTYAGKYLTYFNDVIMVFFLAWLLAFILSPIANAPGSPVPAPAAGAGRHHRLQPADRASWSRPSCWWLSSSYSSINNLIQQLAVRRSEQLRKNPRSRWQDRLNSSAAAGSASSTRSTCSWRTSRTAHRPDQAAGRHRRRQPRHLRQPALHLLPVAVHGRRSGSDRQLPLPPRPARATRTRPAARAQRRPGRSAASCAARRSWASCTACSTAASVAPRPAVHAGHGRRRRACCRRSRSSGRSSPGCRRCSWPSSSSRRPRCRS